MAHYKLAPSAVKDFDVLYEFGIDNFGLDQANKYTERIEERFSILAKDPLLYPAVDYIRKGYRRSVCGAHSIYYKVMVDGVEIIRILGQQDYTKVK